MLSSTSGRCLRLRSIEGARRDRAGCREATGAAALAADLTAGAAFLAVPPAFFRAVFLAGVVDFLRDFPGFPAFAPGRRFGAGRDLPLAAFRVGAFDFLRAGAALAPRLTGFDAGLAARLALEVRRRACFLAMPV